VFVYSFIYTDILCWVILFLLTAEGAETAEEEWRRV